MIDHIIIYYIIILKLFIKNIYYRIYRIIHFYHRRFKKKLIIKKICVKFDCRRNKLDKMLPVAQSAHD